MYYIRRKIDPFPSDIRFCGKLPCDICFETVILTERDFAIDYEQEYADWLQPPTLDSIIAATPVVNVSRRPSLSDLLERHVIEPQVVTLHDVIANTKKA